MCRVRCVRARHPHCYMSQQRQRQIDMQQRDHGSRERRLICMPTRIRCMPTRVIARQRMHVLQHCVRMCVRAHVAQPAYP